MSKPKRSNLASFKKVILSFLTKVHRLLGKSDLFGMDIILDVNIELFPIEKGKVNFL